MSLLGPGQGEAARDYFEKSLTIRQRLVQAEPDRADYQQDLALSLVRIATIEGSGGRHRLEQARTILGTLRERGARLPGLEAQIQGLDDMLGS